MEIDLKNVAILVTKKICKNRSQACKITFKQIVPVLFQSFVKALALHFNSLFESNFADYGHCPLGVS